MDQEREEKRLIHSRWLEQIILFSSMIMGVLMHFLTKDKDYQILFSGMVLTVIVGSIYSVILHMNENFLFCKIKHTLLFWLCFVISFICLGVQHLNYSGIWWLLIVAFAALDAGLEVAVLIHAVVMLEYMVLELLPDGDIYQFVIYIIFGSMVAVLFSLVREKKALPYLAIIILAIDVVLYFVQYHFQIQIVVNRWGDILSESVSILGIVIMAYVYLKYSSKMGQADSRKHSSFAQENLPAQIHVSVEDNQSETEKVSAEKNLSETADNILEELKSLTEEDLLQSIIDENFVLMKRLREYSKALYDHSMKIGEISAEAAGIVGGDELLAKAGGIYHEIGRMIGEEKYIPNGQSLGQEYQFPEKLLAIMKQHNASYALPQNKEAAVVMLTDYILSTNEYLIKTGNREKISDQKLISSILENRLSKGFLKDSQLNIANIADLEEFYIKKVFYTLV